MKKKTIDMKWTGDRDKEIHNTNDRSVILKMVY